MVFLLLILLLELQWSKRVQERLRRLGGPLKKEAVGNSPDASTVPHRTTGYNTN